MVVRTERGVHRNCLSKSSGEGVQVAMPQDGEDDSQMGWC